MLKVNYYFRKERPNKSRSVELVFEHVISALQGRISYDIVCSRFYAKGILRRLYNVVEAAFRQNGGVNHITGDEHYLTLLLNKKATILTIHDLNMIYYPSIQGKKWLVFFYRWFWYSLPVKRAAVVTVVSKATKSELLQNVKCDPEKIKVIYNPINPIFRTNLKQFNADKPVILQVGTAYSKNLSRLAQALSGITCQLDIIGQPRAEDIEVLEQHHIDYRWQSNLTDQQVYQKYVNCDLVAFVSLWEGFGLPIVEAQVVGRPVVTSKLYAMPEVAGEGAMFVDPYNVEEIRDGVLKIVKGKAYRESIIESGLRNSARFNSKNIADRYLHLYSDLA